MKKTNRLIAGVSASQERGGCLLKTDGGSGVNELPDWVFDWLINVRSSVPSQQREDGRWDQRLALGHVPERGKRVVDPSHHAALQHALAAGRGAAGRPGTAHSDRSAAEVMA